MFRLVVPHKTLALYSRLYHCTSALSKARPKFNPEDWDITEHCSGGLDLGFSNRKTGENTGDTPEGMSAAEILAIPGAKKYWSTIEDVEDYIAELAELNAKAAATGEKVCLVELHTNLAERAYRRLDSEE